MSYEQRLTELGIVLPEAPRPMASYVPAVRSGAQLWIAGQPPGAGWDGGQIGREYSVEQGAAAARASGLNILAQVRHAVGSLDRVRQVLKVVGFVNVAPGMDQAHLVVNGCSDLMVEVFGDAGRHARSAVGTSTLPMNIPVEIEAVFELDAVLELDA